MPIGGWGSFTSNVLRNDDATVVGDQKVSRVGGTEEMLKRVGGGNREE
jgi:hypothetical protein